MRSDSRPSSSASRWRISATALVIGAALVAGCSKAPSSPSGQGPLLGTWTGTITSETIGRGTATIVIATQVGPDVSPLLSGTWTFAFPNREFGTAGPFVAALNREGTVVGFTFDRSRVPCPSEPGGSAERSILANMTRVGQRMQGNYIVGGCPGGTLEVTRQ